MHSETYNEYVVHFNGDRAGSATITNTITGESMDVPCTLLLNFGANYVREKRMRQIEDMELDELLS